MSDDLKNRNLLPKVVSLFLFCIGMYAFFRNRRYIIKRLSGEVNKLGYRCVKQFLKIRSMLTVCNYIPFGFVMIIS